MVYCAGIEFVDIEPKVAAAIMFAYPPQASAKSSHRGPIKVRVNSAALEEAFDGDKHKAN
jgi:hypothetical protein